MRSAYELQTVFLDECVRKNHDIGSPGLKHLQQFSHKLLLARVHQLPTVHFLGEESIRRGLISQNVLFEDSGKIAFSHQTLFDALVVQHALANGEDLLSFILAHPPFPFLRASVQTFIFHLRAHNPELFSRQVTKTLDNKDVAYHLKRLIVETIGTLNIVSDHDWPLIRRIFKQHPTLFERMFWKTTGNGWFRVLLDSWLPILGNNDQRWRDNFLRRLERWGNQYSTDVIQVWIRAIDEAWHSGNSHDLIIWQLRGFSQWETEGVETLLRRITKLELREHNGFLDTLSQYAITTGRGHELLWQVMTRAITTEGISRLELNNQLNCNFRKKDNLESLLKSSDLLLNQVLADIKIWAHREQPRHRQLNSAFIDSCPSYDQRHSRRDMYHSRSLAILLEALENTIHDHGNENTAWWQTNELRLRGSNLLLFQYFLLKPYSSSPKSNIEGISSLLTNPELLRYGRLDYEVGQLIKAGYFLLPEAVQIKNQELILSLYIDDDWSELEGNDELPQWVYKRKYDYLLWIPIIYRTSSSQKLVYQFEGVFGRYLSEPDIWSRGGTVGYSLTLDQMLNLSDQGLLTYCKHYEGYDDGFGAHPGDHLSGDQEMVKRRLSEAAAYDPPRYLKLVPLFITCDLDISYPQSIVHGVADHLRYRYGNISPASEFKRVQPEVNGEPLAVQLLDLMENSWLWSDTREFNLFSIPEACCDVLRQHENIEKLVFILFQHYFMLRIKQVREYSDKYQQNTEDGELRHIRFHAINSDWGHIGSGVAKLCNRLLEEELEVPELLFPLMRHLVKSSEKSANTVIDHIPYMTSMRPEWGYQLFSDIFDDNPSSYLWQSAQHHLYYAYHSNFEYVKPYLECMLHSGSPDAIKAWGLLSTMCHLSGHISQDRLFEQLTTVNQEEVWIAVTQVFEANLDKHKNDGMCISGLTRVLNLELDMPRVVGAVEDAFDPETNGSCIGTDFARLYIEKASFNEDRWSIKHLLDWMADLSDQDPLASLELVELLSDRLPADFAKQLYDGKSLIQALNTFLREADETGDENLITRVINLQDKLLHLDLSGIGDYFSAAENH